MGKSGSERMPCGEPYRSAVSCRVMENRRVAEGYFVMSLELPAAFDTPLPGQFVMLRAKGVQAPLLGRPLSVYAFERGEKGATLEVLYKVAGTGTLLFSGLPDGGDVEVLGPLGGRFEISPGVKNVILVAGGVGVAPLSFLASHCRGDRADARPRITCYVGAGSADALVGLDRLEASCSDVRICTDDGSCGHHGLVTELLEKDFSLLDSRDSVICACGPSAMLKRMAELLEKHTVACQISMEERMACGLGACLGCAVAVKAGDGGFRYRRVCKDGPIFDIRELIWDR